MQIISHTKDKASAHLSFGNQVISTPGPTLPMKKICGIYKITSPSGRIYIGQSLDCHRRFKQYKSTRAKDQPRLNRSFRKYGVECHVFEIIDVCEPDKLNSHEMYFIDYYKSFDTANGLNLRAGGEQGGACSEETKRRIAISHTGKKLSEEHKKKIGAAGIGRVFSAESRLKKSKTLKGMKRDRRGKRNKKSFYGKHQFGLFD